MKRSWFIILGGLAVSMCACFCVYYHNTDVGRAVDRNPRPELGWLQREFHLTDAQLARVRELHNYYAPKCEAMCRAIDAKNAEIRWLLASTNTMTSEIRQALAQSAEIRAECETAMLDHFYKVAQAMPREQAKRYLDWVQRQTLKPSRMMPEDWLPTGMVGRP